MTRPRTTRARTPRAAAPGADTLEAVVAMAEPTRLQILFRLGRRRRLCVGDIARGFAVSRPAISHHLKVLKTSGLVRTEREGQEIYYTVQMDRLVAALRALADSLERCCPPGRPR